MVAGDFWTVVVLYTDPLRYDPFWTLHQVTRPGGPRVPRAQRLLEHSGREPSEHLRSSSTLKASSGMATSSRLLEVDDEACSETNAEHVMPERGSGHTVTIVRLRPLLNGCDRRRPRVRFQLDLPGLRDVRLQRGSRRWDTSRGRARRVTDPGGEGATSRQMAGK